MTRTAVTDSAPAETRSAWRPVRGLLVAYVTLCALTVVAEFLLRDDTADVTTAAWTRTVIVLLAALLTLWFAGRAARGSRRMLLRLRIVTAVQLVAIVVIVALPGAFPVWLRIEQAVCGLLLAGVVVLVNGRRIRAS